MDRRRLLLCVMCRLFAAILVATVVAASHAGPPNLEVPNDNSPADSSVMYPPLFGNNQPVVVLSDGSLSEGSQPYSVQYPGQTSMPMQAPVAVQSPNAYSVMAPAANPAYQPYAYPGVAGPGFAPGYAATAPGLSPYPLANPNGAGSICRYATAEFMFLKLNSPRQANLAFDQNISQNVLTTADFDLDYEPGVKASFGYQFDNRWAIEGVYFGLQNWKESAETRGGVSNLRLPGDLGLALDNGGSADARQVTASYSARLHNAEINGWRKIDDTLFAVLLGFRYINFTETLDIHAIDADNDQSDYQIKTKNNYFGGQLGGQFATQWGNLELQVIGKAGVYDNVAQQNSQATSENAVLIRDTQAKVNRLAFVGDAGLNGRVKLMEKLYFRGGYYVLWMNGLVRAPDQLDYTNTASSGGAIISNGTAFLHGGTIGLETWW